VAGIQIASLLSRLNMLCDYVTRGYGDHAPRDYFVFIGILCLLELIMLGDVALDLLKRHSGIVWDYWN